MIGEVAPIFSLYYQSHFTQRFGDELESVMHEYAAQVQANGLKRLDVMRGLKKIREGRAGKWVPNPLEFAELCKPDADELGLPTKEQVRDELKRVSAWRVRHPHKPFPYSSRMSELVCAGIYDRYRLASDEKREQLIEKAYTKWFKVAQKEGLPEKMSAIAETVEPRPKYQEYFDNKSVSPDLMARLNRIGDNFKKRRAS